MKTLKFAPHLVPLILSGEKTTTWRLFDDKDLQVDDELLFLNKATGTEIARARITEIKEKRLRDVVEEDYVGHERMDEDIVAHYRRYYGDRVQPDSMVKMIRFETL